MLITEILKLPIPEQITILSEKVSLPDYTTLENQWDPTKHDVFDASKRPNKAVKKETGQISEDGKPVYETTYELVNRIAVPFQRIIVNRAVGFLLGNPVKIKDYSTTPAQEQLFDMVVKTLDDNKIDYFNRKLARTVMSQCEAAELWYMVEDPEFWAARNENIKGAKFKMRVKLLSPKAGDKLYPYFDETGDMVAFSRGYSIKGSDGKTIEHYDTWTEDYTIKRENKEGTWIVDTKPNLLKKIPVVYYSQEESEWETVQAIIDRFESKISNFGDTNDYFGSPMVKVKGKIISLPGKNSSGKVIELDENADADYMSWNHAPESEKIEFEILEKMIYAMTQTPNISFEQMKGLGSALSGFAIKLMFTDAHLKTENKIELFGEMFVRRLNLLKHILGTVINAKLSAEVNTLYLEPVFTPYLPKNTKEEIETLSTARGGKPIMSNQTAIENNPLIADVDEELERMKQDDDAAMAIMQQELTGTF